MVKNIFIMFAYTFCSLTSSVNAKDIDYAGIRIPDRSGKAMTVLGIINPKKLGDTLMHEHLFINYWLPPEQPGRWEYFHRDPPRSKKELEIWNETFSVDKKFLYRLGRHSKDAFTLSNIDDAINETRLFQELGGQTIVDLTTIGLNRQPKKLRKVSKETGVHIVMGTGFYRRAFHPKDMGERTQQDLTRQIVTEIIHGVDDTGIKAGIIGEIPVQYLEHEPKESDELRVLKAAAHASQLTGAAISLHLLDIPKYLWGDVLDILENSGADLSRVIIGHIENSRNTANMDFFESLLKRGVYLQFDFLGTPLAYRNQEINTLKSIKKLIDHGYSTQLLVSHDIFSKLHLTKFGGNGLTYVHSVFIPYLKSKGVDETDIRNIIEVNPRRLLTFVRPKVIN